MKTTYKIYSYYLAIVSLIIIVTGSCKKSDNPAELKFLDVNIKFQAAVKPAVGDELAVRLYYTSVNGKERATLVPDAEIKTILTQDNIDQGLRVTFEDFKEIDSAFVSASVDLDDDGEIGSGDLAIFYNDKSFEGVESGDENTDNVAKEYAITINMSRTIGNGENEPLTDIDGNEYATVVIGSQKWMAENLRVTKYRNGDVIVSGLNNSEWSAAVSGAYAIYPFAGVEGINSDAEMAAKYGLLYNWHAVNDARGICPEGWRAATDDDWKQLEKFLGMAEEDLDKTVWRGTQGVLLKSVEDWEYSPDNAGTDDFGFKGMPGGVRLANGNFDRLGTFAYFWTATSPGGTTAVRRLLRNNYSQINRSVINKNDGNCVRCLQIQ